MPSLKQGKFLLGGSIITVRSKYNFQHCQHSQRNAKNQKSQEVYMHLYYVNWSCFLHDSGTDSGEKSGRLEIKWPVIMMRTAFSLQSVHIFRSLREKSSVKPLISWNLLTALKNIVNSIYSGFCSQNIPPCRPSSDTFSRRPKWPEDCSFDTNHSNAQLWTYTQPSITKSIAAPFDAAGYPVIYPRCSTFHDPAFGTTSEKFSRITPCPLFMTP